MYTYTKIRRTLSVFALLVASALSLPDALAAQTKEDVIVGLEDLYGHYSALARELWENPELGYLEANTAALLQQELEKAGFVVESGVAGIPTAFTATYGSGMRSDP